LLFQLQEYLFSCSFLFVFLLSLATLGLNTDLAGIAGGEVKYAKREFDYT